MTSVNRSPKPRNTKTPRAPEGRPTAEPLRIADEELFNLLSTAGSPITLACVSALTDEQARDAEEWAHAVLRVEAGRPGFLPGGDTEIPDRAPTSGVRLTSGRTLPAVVGLWLNLAQDARDSFDDAVIAYEAVVGDALAALVMSDTSADPDDIADRLGLARDHVREATRAAREFMGDMQIVRAESRGAVS